MTLSDAPSQIAITRRIAMAYAAGTLSPAMALLAETHAALSSRAAREIALADTIAGALFEMQSPLALAPGALEKVFARIAEEPAAEAKAAPGNAKGRFREDIADLPAPIRDVALAALTAHGWSFAAPGIRTLTLDVGGDAKAQLLRIEPGAAAPEHSHDGEEHTLVLTGAFHDARGVYRVGEIAVADSRITHRPTGEAGAICYSLAVTDAPLAFTGALGLAQRLWKH